MKLVLRIVFIFFIYSILIIARQDNGITIKGRVIEEETGAPIENVNVFLANTTIGTSTAKDGNFVISRVPFGSYNIIFSFLGYEVETRDIYSFKPYTFNFNISLKLKPINLKQVNVTGTIPEDWKENLKIFTRVFIGESENSKKTKFINPEVLNFVKEKGSKVIKVYSDSVLKIENDALGYKLYIILDSVVYIPGEYLKYMFYPRFEELSPARKEDKETWEDNRRKTYLDSPRHFFFSLVHNHLEEDYYTMHEGPGIGAIFPKDLSITSDRDSAVFYFNYMGKLEVRAYLGNPSILNFIYPSALIDKYGNLLTSLYSVEIYGYWAKQRIADLLPRDYIYSDK